MPERPASLRFDRIAAEYDETRGGEARGVRVAERLAPLLPPGRVLEVGVGTGIVAAALAGHGHDVVGVDLSAPMLARAAVRLPGRVAQADAEALPVADAAVPAAYSVWVLHLVRDVRSVLAEVARVLVPGGRYVVVPAATRTSPEEDPVAALVWRMHDDLAGGTPRGDDVDRVVALATEVGLGVTLHEPELEPYEESPASIADRIESRTMSVLWDVDEDRWRRYVAPVVAELRAYPEPDRPRVRHARQVWPVLRRPARPG